MRKKLLLLFVCSLMSVWSFAQKETYEDNLTWTLENDVLTISGTGEMANYIFSSAPWDDVRLQIKQVKIEDGVTSIGSYAFSLCSELISVVIGSGVTSIDFVTAFKGCENFAAIEVNDANKYYASLTGVLFNKNLTTLIKYPEGKTDKEYSVPDGITNIENYAFIGCSKLTSVTIPNHVKNIGHNVFSGCKFLTSVSIGNGVGNIGSETFIDCSNLTCIEVDDANEFYTSLTGVLFNKNQTILIKYPEGKSDEEYSIPAGVTDIESNAFRNCNKLISVIISGSVTNIGNYAFAYCTNLSFIDIPDGVKNIGSYAFYDTPWYDNLSDGVIYIAKALYAYKGMMPANTSIDIPDGISSITGEAFNYCTNLIGITIPNSVTSIGHNAFNYCTRLFDIVIPNSVTSIGAGAFTYTPWYDNQPAGIIYINNILYQYKGTMPANTAIEVRSGTVNIAEWAFYNCSGLTSINIPNSVTHIKNHAFFSCTGLRHINIPNNVTYIGNYAFSHSGLTSIAIPNSVVSIGEEAFLGCTGLISVTIPESVTSIGDETFSGCSNLMSITNLNPAPVFIEEFTFANVNKESCVLKVPVGSVEQYRQATGWEKFSRIEAIEETIVKIPVINDLHIYPNPVQESFFLKNIERNTIVTVLDVAGKIVLQKIVNPDEAIMVSLLQKGVYFINVKEQCMKIIKR